MTFVLIHGAWHGGWCWKRVCHVLTAAGAAVHTPTLTGLGERAHLASPDVGLATHVQDVVNVLACEELAEVVLVGHSYAGVVVTAVADRVPDRIARLVYLDAVVPRDGECLLDRVSPEFRRRIDALARDEGDGWLVPPLSAERLGLVADADIDWVMPKLVPHPYRTFREPVALSFPPGGTAPRTYINCIGTQPRGSARTPQADGIDDYHELATGHDAMVTAPDDVAHLLLRAIHDPWGDA
ncbi:MAG: alpha/beta fold hydrolase [Burkholderiales bacterium]|nr:alpha/beta fold hydrolase [Burkholderiales bacterium]